MNKNVKIPASDLPFNFDGYEDQYGSIEFGEFLCPGVYYVVTKLPCRFHGEYIVVVEDSPAVSQKARGYGKLLSTTPPVLLCEMDYFDKGRWVVEYEAYQYMEEHGIPLPEDESLWETELRGMEVCPEYFGEFPVPANTPWGPPIQHIRLWNGLDWLKTENDGWVLAVAYPLCDDLHTKTQNLGLLLKEDEDKLEEHCNIFSCRFYPYGLSSVVLFELLECSDQPWESQINRSALHNMILERFPKYVTEREENDPDLPSTQKILATPGAGTEFYPLPQN